ncbi:MAG: DNA polymerase [Proteobacteria bacterium]|nr:DNA polymerase [Pseudomonadota bacterium]
MSLRSLFVDFNSYFASVEQQVEPALRGRPVGVAPVMAETTCCIAASVEAKTFGVRTGTMVRDARKLCPQIAIVPAQPALYVEFHHRLKAAIETCIPIDYVGSIDEVGCELIGRERVRANAIAIARNIKAAVHDVGDWLRCSIGIAPNHFLSKTATDMQKPDGLVVLEHGDLPQALYRLELSDLCGIGPAMEQRLHAYGIRCVEQLCALDVVAMRDVWGSTEGERFFQALHGQWQAHHESVRASLGHSHVLGPEWRTPAGARAVLKKLLVKAAMRLRSEGYVAQAMSVRVRHLRADSWHGEIRFDATDDSREFLRQLAHALDLRDQRTQRLPLRGGRPEPLAVGVTLHRLQRRDESTGSLFANEVKARAVNGVLDRINRRYGGNTLYFGSMQAALDAAPMRIPFSTIPNTQLELDIEHAPRWRRHVSDIAHQQP